ncbi:TNF receptor-associated factor 6-like [Octopus sinensis]|uniref:TNF receptor-associated factor 6-like n=1 Tax=Octopus sinensis TaxID=2607531 RepID=A0A6P7SND4_9MOLL|nr:TNF receptor-associated factor 6-like [Octopus sinensis]XP_036360285.1 TNF receptor-associated factor 6-like [Octopus sinensis]XP_036360286.1 TNF receptor-associated factor 6-like [Octopus sinensis]
MMSHTFDEEFELSLKDVNQRFICPICLALMSKPMQTKCGHRFCKKCISGVIAGRDRVKCPVDNNFFWVQSDLFIDQAFERELNSLLLSCPNQRNGCLWNGEKDAFKSHVTNCQFVFINCELCGKDVLSKTFATHKSTDCPCRSVLCELCEEEVPYNNKLKHQVLSCELFPVGCPQCGQKGIRRKDIAQHIDQASGHCPLTLILCHYQPFGCTHMDYRKNMSYHISHAVEYHNVLLMKFLQNLEKRLESIEQNFDSNINLSSNITNKIEQMQRAISMRDAVQNIFKEKYSGCLLWQIDLNSNGCVFISPSFYTANPGYRIEAQLDISGCQDSILYITFSLSLKEGMYDDVLVFPFSGACLVTVFDQMASNGKENYSLFIECSQLQRYNENCPGSSPFQVCHKLMKADDFFSPRYIKNKTVFLEVKVMQAVQSQSQGKYSLTNQRSHSYLGQ